MLDARVKFRHLQTFIEVARQTSVSKAADALSLTQPAVTRTIRELEDILNVKLVEKDGRGIRITQLGEVFLKYAGASLAAARRGIDAIDHARSASGPPVRVGALPTVSASVMPAAVAHFLEAGTGSPIKIVTGENAVLLEQLRSGDLDVVIGRLAAPEQMTSLSFEPLYRETVVFAVRTGHPLRALRTFSLPEIEGYPILMPTRGSIIRPFVERFLLNNGISSLRTEIETVSDSFGRAFLQTSDAVWIISRGVIENDIAAGTVAVLPLDTSETIGSVGFSTRAADEPGPAAMVFMRSVRETVRRAGKV